jgi:hypothetical protein
MSEDSQIKEQLISLEEKLLNPAVRKSVEEVSQLLADDYSEIGSSGKVYNKKDTIEALKKEPTGQISAHDCKVNLLTPEVALVTYIAVKKDKANDEIKSLRSSFWKKTGEKWQIVFHQGTNKIQK